MCVQHLHIYMLTMKEGVSPILLNGRYAVHGGLTVYTPRLHAHDVPFASGRAVTQRTGTTHASVPH